MPRREIRKRKKRRSLKRRLAAKATPGKSSGESGETDTSDDHRPSPDRLGQLQGSHNRPRLPTVKAGKMGQGDTSGSMGPFHCHHQQHQHHLHHHHGGSCGLHNMADRGGEPGFRESAAAHHRGHLAPGSGLRRSGSAREYTTSDSFSPSYSSPGPRLQRGGSTRSYNTSSEPFAKAHSSHKLQRSGSTREYTTTTNTSEDSFGSWTDISSNFKRGGKVSDSRNSGGSVHVQAAWDMPPAGLSTKRPTAAVTVKKPLKSTSSEENIRLQENARNQQPKQVKMSDRITKENTPDKDVQQQNQQQQGDHQEKATFPLKRRSGRRRKRRKSSLSTDSTATDKTKTSEGSVDGKNLSRSSSGHGSPNVIQETVEPHGQDTNVSHNSFVNDWKLDGEVTQSHHYGGRAEQRIEKAASPPLLLPSLSTDMSTSDDLTDTTLQDYNISTTRTEDWVADTWDNTTLRTAWAAGGVPPDAAWDDDFTSPYQGPPAPAPLPTHYSNKKQPERLVLARQGESIESSEYAADDESTPKEELCFDHFNIPGGGPVPGSLLFGGLGALEKATSLITKLAKEMSPEPKPDGSMAHGVVGSDGQMVSELGGQEPSGRGESCIVGGITDGVEVYSEAQAAGWEIINNEQLQTAPGGGTHLHKPTEQARGKATEQHTESAREQFAEQSIEIAKDGAMEQITDPATELASTELDAKQRTEHMEAATDLDTEKNAELEIELSITELPKEQEQVTGQSACQPTVLFTEDAAEPVIELVITELDIEQRTEQTTEAATVPAIELAITEMPKEQSSCTYQPTGLFTEDTTEHATESSIAELPTKPTAEQVIKPTTEAVLATEEAIELAIREEPTTAASKVHSSEQATEPAQLATDRQEVMTVAREELTNPEKGGSEPVTELVITEPTEGTRTAEPTTELATEPGTDEITTQAIEQVAQPVTEQTVSPPAAEAPQLHPRDTLETSEPEDREVSPARLFISGTYSTECPSLLPVDLVLAQELGVVPLQEGDGDEDEVSQLDNSGDTITTTTTPFYARLPSIEHIEMTCVEWRKQCDSTDFSGHHVQMSDTDVSTKQVLYNNLQDNMECDDHVVKYNIDQPDIITTPEQVPTVCDETLAVESDGNTSNMASTLIGVNFDAQDEQEKSLTRGSTYEPAQVDIDEFVTEDRQQEREISPADSLEDRIGSLEVIPNIRETTPVQVEGDEGNSFNLVVNETAHENLGATGQYQSDEQSYVAEDSKLTVDTYLMHSLQKEQWGLNQAKRTEAAEATYQMHAAAHIHLHADFSDDSLDGVQDDTQDQTKVSDEGVSRQQQPSNSEVVGTSKDGATAAQVRLLFTVGVQEQPGRVAMEEIKETNPSTSKAPERDNILHLEDAQSTQSGTAGLHLQVTDEKDTDVKSEPRDPGPTADLSNIQVYLEVCNYLQKDQHTLGMLTLAELAETRHQEYLAQQQTEDIEVIQPKAEADDTTVKQNEESTMAESASLHTEENKAQAPEEVTLQITEECIIQTTNVNEEATGDGNSKEDILPETKEGDVQAPAMETPLVSSTTMADPEQTNPEDVADVLDDIKLAITSDMQSYQCAMQEVEHGEAAMEKKHTADFQNSVTVKVCESPPSGLHDSPYIHMKNVEPDGGPLEMELVDNTDQSFEVTENQEASESNKVENENRQHSEVIKDMYVSMRDEQMKLRQLAVAQTAEKLFQEARAIYKKSSRALSEPKTSGDSTPCTEEDKAAIQQKSARGQSRHVNVDETKSMALSDEPVNKLEVVLSTSVVQDTVDSDGEGLIFMNDSPSAQADLPVCLTMQSDHQQLQQAVAAQLVEKIYQGDLAKQSDVTPTVVEDEEKKVTIDSRDTRQVITSSAARISPETEGIDGKHTKKESKPAPMSPVKSFHEKAVQQSMHTDYQMMQWTKSAEMAETSYQETLVRFVNVIYHEPKDSELYAADEEETPMRPLEEEHKKPAHVIKSIPCGMSTIEVAPETPDSFEEHIESFTQQNPSVSVMQSVADVCTVQSVVVECRYEDPKTKGEEAEVTIALQEDAEETQQPLASSVTTPVVDVDSQDMREKPGRCIEYDANTKRCLNSAMKEECQKLWAHQQATLAEANYQSKVAEQTHKQSIQEEDGRSRNAELYMEVKRQLTPSDQKVNQEQTEQTIEDVAVTESLRDVCRKLQWLKQAEYAEVVALSSLGNDCSERIEQGKQGESGQEEALSISQSHDLEERQSLVETAHKEEPGVCAPKGYLQAVTPPLDSVEIGPESPAVTPNVELYSVEAVETSEEGEMAQEEVDLAIDEALLMLSDEEADETDLKGEHKIVVAEDSIKGLVTSLVEGAIGDAFSAIQQRSADQCPQDDKADESEDEGSKEPDMGDLFSASEPEEEIEKEQEPIIGGLKGADKILTVSDDGDGSSLEPAIGDLFSASESEGEVEKEATMGGVVSDDDDDEGSLEPAMGDLFSASESDGEAELKNEPAVVEQASRSEDDDNGGSSLEPDMGDLFSESEPEGEADTENDALQRAERRLGKSVEEVITPNTDLVSESSATAEGNESIPTKPSDSDDDDGSLEPEMGDLFSGSESEVEADVENKAMTVVRAVSRIDDLDTTQTSSAKHPTVDAISESSEEEEMGDLFGDTESEGDKADLKKTSDAVTVVDVTPVIETNQPVSPSHTIEEIVETEIIEEIFETVEEIVELPEDGDVVPEDTECLPSKEPCNTTPEEPQVSSSTKMLVSHNQIGLAECAPPSDTTVYLQDESQKLEDMQLCAASETAYREHMANLEDVNNNNMMMVGTTVQRSPPAVEPTSRELSRDAFSPPVGGPVQTDGKTPEEKVIADEILRDSGFWEEVWQSYRDECRALWQLTVCEQAESMYMERQSAVLDTAQRDEPLEDVLPEEKTASLDQPEPEKASQELQPSPITGTATCSVEIVMPDVFGVAFVEASCQDYEQMKSTQDAEVAEEMYMTQYVIENEDCQELIEIFADQIQTIDDGRGQETDQVMVCEETFEAQIEPVAQADPVAATVIAVEELPRVGLYKSLCSHLDPYADSDSEEEECELHGRVEKWKYREPIEDVRKEEEDLERVTGYDINEEEVKPSTSHVTALEPVAIQTDTYDISAHHNLDAPSPPESRCSAPGMSTVLALPLDEGFKRQLREEMGEKTAMEQLVKILEDEGRHLRRILAEEQNNMADMKCTIKRMQTQLSDEKKITEKYQAECTEMKKARDEDENKIAKLQSELEEKSKAYQSLSDSLIDARLAENRATSAESRVRMLETELVAARNQGRRLLIKLASVDRDRSEMLAETVHHELLSIADDRANLADSKVMQLESKLIEAKNHLEEERSRKRNLPTTCHSVKDYPSLISTTLASSPSGALFNPPAVSACTSTSPIVSSKIAGSGTVPKSKAVATPAKKVPRQNSPGTPIPGSITDEMDSDIEESKDSCGNGFNFQMFSIFGDAEHQPMCTTSDSVYSSSTSNSGSGSTTATEDSPDRQTPGTMHFFGPQSSGEDQNSVSPRRLAASSSFEVTAPQATSTLFKPITPLEDDTSCLDDVDLPDVADMQGSMNMELRISESPSDDPSELSDWSSSSGSDKEECELRIVEPEETESSTCQKPAKSTLEKTSTSVWSSPQHKKSQSDQPTQSESKQKSHSMSTSLEAGKQGVAPAGGKLPLSEKLRLGETQYLRDPNGNQDLPTTML